MYGYDEYREAFRKEVNETRLISVEEAEKTLNDELHVDYSSFTSMGTHDGHKYGLKKVISGSRYDVKEGGDDYYILNKYYDALDKYENYMKYHSDSPENFILPKEETHVIRIIR